MVRNAKWKRRCGADGSALQLVESKEQEIKEFLLRTTSLLSLLSCLLASRIGAAHLGVAGMVHKTLVPNPNPRCYPKP
jgi:hypothetical protein